MSLMRRCVMVAAVSLCVAGVMCEKETSSEKYIGRLFSEGSAMIGRTLGHHALKRLAFIFLPVMFTLGVISTLLLGLSVLAVKNLAIGVVLLIVGVSQAVSRLFYQPAVPAPLVLHSRAEPNFAAPAPWPLPAGAAPLYSPWARNDDHGPNLEH